MVKTSEHKNQKKKLEGLSLNTALCTLNLAIILIISKRTYTKAPNNNPNSIQKTYKHLATCVDKMDYLDRIKYFQEV